MNYALLYLLHTLIWFAVSGVSSILFYRSSCMKITTASALGLATFAIHILLRHFNYITA